MQDFTGKAVDPSQLSSSHIPSAFVLFTLNGAYGYVERPGIDI